MWYNPQAMKIEIRHYLNRIGCVDCQTPTLAHLRKLQRSHLLRVPYESFDLWQRRVPDLSVEGLFEKIVARRRGGYCFELNGAFRWLLRSLGYDIRQYFGRWLYGAPLDVPPPQHRVLRVALRGREYITDVGIGMRAPLAPLEFVYDKVQRSTGIAWRIVRDDRLRNLVQMNEKGDWKNYFSFGDEAAEDVDFLYVNHFLVTEPTSMFRRGFLTYLPLADGGARSLVPTDDPETGRRVWCFTEWRADGSVDKECLHTTARRADVLERRFGLPRDLAELP